MPVLNFKCKSVVRSYHFTVPFCPLEIDKKKSFAQAGTHKPSLEDNLIIHGDNLYALKALIPHYEGKIKCIYIDPPYNTGNENWKYNDNVNNPVMQNWRKQNGIGKDDMERHDKWLCMMWPRLELLHKLLSDDGVIFISVDDNEQHRLRMVLDEIFSEENFIGSFIWEGTGKNDSKFISVAHDYIFVYAKNFDMLKTNEGRWRIFKEGLDTIYKKAEELKIKYKSDYKKISEKLQEWFATLNKNASAWQHRHYNMIDENGIFFPGDISWPGGGGPMYDIFHPKTNKAVKKPTRGWIFSSKEKMLSAIKEGLIYFGENENTVPRMKRYLHKTDSQVLNSVIYKDRQSAHQRLTQIFGKSAFKYPKDENILQRIFEAVMDKDAVVLDSFAGSGTTAHAVLDLNKEDGGRRKFILVECEDYANTITAERVRRVIKGVPQAKDLRLQKGLGGSFTYCTLGQELNEENFLRCKSLPTYDVLARYIFYTATGQALEGFKKRGDYYVGKTKRDVAIFVVYQPDKEFLRSDASALHLKREALVLQTMRLEKCKRAYVFAMACFVPPEDLPQKGLVFCQMPFQIHKMLFT